MPARTRCATFWERKKTMIDVEKLLVGMEFAVLPDILLSNKWLRIRSFRYRPNVPLLETRYRIAFLDGARERLGEGDEHDD